MEDHRQSLLTRIYNELCSKKIVLLIGCAIFICLIYFRGYVQDSFHFTHFLQNLNYTTSIIYFACIFLISNALCIPIGLLLNLIAGMLWGTWIGGLATCAIATVGAGLSFLTARILKHYVLEEIFINTFKLQKFTRHLDCADWQFIFAARINPLVPFSISNYLFGFIENLNFRHYIIITFIANLVPVWVVASIGSTLNTLSIDDPNLRSTLSKMCCVLFLLSLFVFLKWFMSRRKLLKIKGLT